MAYNAFMSYSHAADGKLAPALHSALHRLAKPWYRMRALNIFRDKTNLPINPTLWSSIKLALDQAEYFILLASPKAAASIWVGREIEHWLQRHTPDRVLIVLTEGTLTWDPNSQRFDQDRSNALPQPLMRALAEEPLYLDLRWASTEIHLSLRQSRFREAVAELAAALHGRPKDELVGEDIRQHRRTQNLVWSAIAALAILTLSSVIAAYLAFQQKNFAEAQRAEAVQQSRIVLARQLAAQSTSILLQFPDQISLAVLLALESTRLHPFFESNQALRAGLTLLPRAVQSYAYDGSDPVRSRIRALAFSPNRKYLAVARDDGTADVLDLSQGKAIAVLHHEENPGTVVNLPGGGFQWKAPGADAEVTSVAFSPDGQLLATGNNDKTARLWDAASGREILRLKHEGAVSSVAFNFAGTYLATGSKGGKARIFEVGTGQQVLESKHEKEVREVAFSPDGSSLAAISTDGGISLSSLDTKEVRQAWYAGISGLGLAFSRDGKKLATANGNFAFVWEVEAGKELLKVMHANSPDEALDHLVGWVDDVAFSPDGNYVATGGRDGAARLWSLETGQEVVRLQHGAGVNAVAFSPDGTTLSTAAFDGTARLWEIPSGRERLRSAHPGGSEVTVFSPDGSQVASGGMDGAIKVWDLTRGDQVARMVHPADVVVVGFSPDGSTLATAEKKGGIRLWSAQGELKATLRQPAWAPKRLVFSEDGRYLLVAARNPGLLILDVGNELAATRLPRFRNAGDPALSSRYVAAWDREHGSGRLWETAGGRELPPVKVANLWNLTFDSTGSFLATMQEDDRGNSVIRVWVLPEWHERGLRVTARSHSAFALGPRGKYLAVEQSEPGAQRYSVNRYVDVWDAVAATRVTRVPQDKGVDLVTFDPSGKLLITGGKEFGDRELRVWDLPTGTLKVGLSHGESIRAVRFSAEENILATVSSGNVYVWNFSTGKLLSQLTDAGDVRDVRFSPDGGYLLTGSADNTAILWLWKIEDLRDEACKRLARNLLSNEWERYLGDSPYRKTCPNLPADD